MSTPDSRRRPLVVGIGGTTRAASSTERALSFALRGAEQAGARTHLFGGAFLHSLPHYAPESEQRAHPAGGEPVHRFHVTKLPPVAASSSEQARQTHVFGPLPASLFRPLPPFEDLPRPLSPSGASALIDEGKEAVVDKASPVLDADAERPAGRCGWRGAIGGCGLAPGRTGASRTRYRGCAR